MLSISIYFLQQYENIGGWNCLAIIMNTGAQIKHFQDITAEHILFQRKANAGISKTFQFVLMKQLQNETKRIL